MKERLYIATVCNRSLFTNGAQTCARLKTDHEPRTARSKLGANVKVHPGTFASTTARQASE